MGVSDRVLQEVAQVVEESLKKHPSQQVGSVAAALEKALRSIAGAAILDKLNHAAIIHQLKLVQFTHEIIGCPHQDLRQPPQQSKPLTYPLTADALPLK